MENDIYGSPKAELNIETDGANENPLASRWTRLGASIIDGIIILVFTLPIMYFTGGFEGFPDGEQPSAFYTLGMGAIGLIFFIIIHGRFLIRDGQTIGKRVLGIKIVTLEGKLPDLSHLAKRYGFYLLIGNLPFVGPIINMINILFIFSESRRCLHDHVGGTKVVQASQANQ